VVAPESHPLASRSELTVAEVLDDTFISYHPDVQPAWAGFHSLDDHRREPPRRMTTHRVLTPPEMLAAMASRQAITAVPASDARIIEQALRGVVAIPLVDAAPATLALTWRKDSPNPVVEELVSFAERLKASGSDGAASDRG
jgi:DNA-binding transcriptional LysR family regulator